jgi:hypothetical protein
MDYRVADSAAAGNRLSLSSAAPTAESTACCCVDKQNKSIPRNNPAFPRFCRRERRTLQHGRHSSTPTLQPSILSHVHL